MYVKITFAVVQNLAADFHLGREYLDSQVDRVSPETRSVKLKNIEEVPVIRREANGRSMLDIHEPKINKRGIRDNNAVRMYESITMLPHSVRYLRVQTRASGLPTVEARYRKHMRSPWKHPNRSSKSILYSGDELFWSHSRVATQIAYCVRYWRNETSGLWGVVQYTPRDW